MAGNSCRPAALLAPAARVARSVNLVPHAAVRAAVHAAVHVEGEGQLIEENTTVQVLMRRTSRSQWLLREGRVGWGRYSRDGGEGGLGGRWELGWGIIRY